MTANLVKLPARRRRPMRALTAADLEATGLPVRFGEDGQTTLDVQAMSRLIARLCGLRLAAVRALPAPEWMALLERVMVQLRTVTLPVPKKRGN